MKRLLLGLIVGLLIGTAGTALASSNFIQAQIAKFNIQINDNEAVEVEAVVVEGVSNYPIRVIMDLLGNEVDYVDKTRTIVVTTPIHEIGSEDLTEEEITVVDNHTVKPMPEYTPTDPNSYSEIKDINDRIAVLEGLLWSFGEVAVGVGYSAEQKQIAQDVVVPIVLEKEGLEARRKGLQYQADNADRIAEEQRQRGIAELNRKIRNTEREIEALERSIPRDRASIESNERHKMAGWEETNAIIENRILDNEIKITNLQSELADLQAQLADLQ